jgi:transposase InsO family protein
VSARAEIADLDALRVLKDEDQQKDQHDRPGHEAAERDRRPSPLRRLRRDLLQLTGGRSGNGVRGRWLSRTPAPKGGLARLVDARLSLTATLPPNGVPNAVRALDEALKRELVNRRSWPSRRELQSAVFEYIEAFYNRQRRHSTLAMLSPVAYEQLRLSPLGG